MNYPFTVEEINLICMYSRDNRQKAIDGLYHAMASQQDSDMIMLIYQTITKLSWTGSGKRTERISSQLLI